MPTPEFAQRLNDHLDGDLDEAGRAALQREVETDPAAKAAFEEAMEFESLLTAAHSPDAAGERILRGLAQRLHQDNIVRGTRFRSWLAAAAALVIGLAVVWWSLCLDHPIAHRVLAGEVRVSGQSVQEIADGQALVVAGAAPATVQLADGSLAEFAAGSAATIKGPQDDLRQVIELTSGTGRFRVERGANQFRVATRLGQVTVLGTEFSVALRPEDELEATHDKSSKTKETMKPKTKALLALAVVVTLGQVQVDIGGKTYTLSAGQTAYAKEGDRKAIREMSGEVTKMDTKSITVTTRKDSGSRDETFSLASTTEVLVETDEVEPVPGKESKTRPKLAAGALGDLKVGQRVKVQHEAGAATRIIVLQVRAAVRDKEGERKKDPAPGVQPKPRKGGEGDRAKPEQNLQPKPRKEGGER